MITQNLLNKDSLVYVIHTDEGYNSNFIHPIKKIIRKVCLTIPIYDMHDMGISSCMCGK